MNEVLIYYQDVEIERDGVSIIHQVNFKQHKGDFTYLIGKIGSGKSSFFETLYCDLPIYNGTAFVYNYDLKKIKKKNISLLRRKIGIIFRNFQLLTDRSVIENLKFALQMTGWRKKKAINNCIEEVLLQVEMENKGSKMPHELSGGEQQKIMIARALLNSPKIILADEPTENLDMDSAFRIVKLLQDISKKGTAVIMATCNHFLIKKFPAKIKKCENKSLFDYEFQNSES